MTTKITKENAEQVKNGLIINRSYWVRWKEDYEFEILRWIGKEKYFVNFLRVDECFEIDTCPISRTESDKQTLAQCLNKYIKEHHTQEECIEFIDGFKACNPTTQIAWLRNTHGIHIEIRVMSDFNHYQISVFRTNDERVNKICDFIKSENKRLFDSYEQAEVAAIEEAMKLIL